MKKKLLLSVMALAIVTLSFVNMGFSLTNKSPFSGLTLKSIESLADGEDPLWEAGFEMKNKRCWTGEYIYVLGISLKVYADFNVCVSTDNNMTACDKNQEQLTADDCK